ncbi:hypothetical protein EV368DRAFT_79770 [Lentinula lateritia]|uniref:Uncharacterized protein n=1 Tax=Lentinula aff. lateritia TaxID=2804960 RepID=A0ACC1U5V5_9AGAR|nr:hypothetical protein F5876DRAFT_74848 [Lentinula aff. lateritia]KAJ3855290.1 hypothetical protein EV368DRAFT_79770 [Lentinula lateritia]
MSLLRNTLFCLLLFGVRAYPQQTSSPTATVASSSTVTAVLSTIDLGGFNLGGETISGFEQEFTTISVVGISSGTGSDGKSETTYSREIIISDAILTTATDGSLIPNTVVPGNIITEIGECPMSKINEEGLSIHADTFVENVSGYYVTDAETITTGSTYEIQGNYETCSFAGPGAVSAGCSDSDYLVEMPTNGGSTTTVYHSGQFSDPVSATTMTLPVQVVASPPALGSGSSSETTVKPQASGSGSDSGTSNTNDGVSLGIGGKYSMTRVFLLSFLAFLAGRM